MSLRRVNVGSLRSWLYRLRREGGEGVRLCQFCVQATARVADIVEIGIAGAVLRVGVGTSTWRTSPSWRTDAAPRPILTLPPSVRIYLASEPVDLRRGHDGLYAIVRNQWRLDPFQRDTLSARGRGAATGSAIHLGTAAASSSTTSAWSAGGSGFPAYGRALAAIAARRHEQHAVSTGSTSSMRRARHWTPPSVERHEPWMTWTYDRRSVARMDGHRPRGMTKPGVPREHRCNWRRLAEAQARARPSSRRAHRPARRQGRCGGEARSTWRRWPSTRGGCSGAAPSAFPSSASCAAVTPTPPMGKTRRKTVTRPPPRTPGSTPGRWPQEGSGSEDAPGLRKEIVEHAVSERTRQCPHCGGTAEPIGTGKFTTEWDYVPGYFVCRRHIQEVVSSPLVESTSHAPRPCACSTAPSMVPASSRT